MSRIFLIPGLGADKRLYKNIDVGKTDVTYIEWKIPHHNDTFETYASQLIANYQISSDDIVIGNSLGGMIAVEIAKAVKLSKVILISSIKTADERPVYFNFFRWFPVYRLIPGSLFNKMGPVIAMVFGKMSSIDAYLFNSMLQNTSPVFIKWAIREILNWRNKILPTNLYHITGDKDKVINHKKVKDPILIKDGQHIMILDKAKKINAELAKILNY